MRAVIPPCKAHSLAWGWCAARDQAADTARLCSSRVVSAYVKWKPPVQYADEESRIHYLLLRVCICA